MALARKLDLWIVAAASTALAASASLLLNDRWLWRGYVRETAGGPPVGRVDQAVGEVRRKIAADYFWMGVRAGDEVFGGDSVYTANDSEAEIELSDARSILRVEPNALVVIRRSADSESLEIRQGRVRGKLAPNRKLKLIVGKKELELAAPESGAPAALRVARGDDGAVRVGIDAGEARLRSGDRVDTLQTNQEAEVAADSGSVKVKTFPIALAVPGDDELVLKDPSERVLFAWEGPAGMASYRVQVAYDSDFAVILLDAPFEATGCAASRTDPSRRGCSAQVQLKGTGLMFWRVVSNLGGSSRVGRFRLQFDSPPSLAFPAFASVIELGAASAPVTLRWEDQSGAREFQVQLGWDNELKSTLLDAIVAGSRLEVPRLEDGNYFWRVRSHDASRSAKWSVVSRFSVQRQLLPTPPIPAGPADLQSYPLSAGGISVELSWKAPAALGAAISYMLEISDRPAFDPPLFTETVQRTSLAWQATAAGAYYWRVRGVTPEGRATVFSAPRRFVVR